MKRKSLVGLIGVVAISLIVILSGCVEEETPVKVPDTSSSITTTTATTALITKAPSDIALTIDDMPDEWMRCDKESIDEKYWVTFSREIFGTDYLTCEVDKYHNISDAKKAFENQKKYEAEKVKITSVELGDESYGWKYGHQSCVHFRKLNIIVDILFESQYGKPDIEHAKKFGEIVEKKQ
ncbi:MAG: hypothetical protein JW878_01510 [Methanomicrobia archaeon]|nr:hypothetical protein [Methanomicrobia archaeon]